MGNSEGVALHFVIISGKVLYMAMTSYIMQKRGAALWRVKLFALNAVRRTRLVSNFVVIAVPSYLARGLSKKSSARIVAPRLLVPASFVEIVGQACPPGWRSRRLFVLDAVSKILLASSIVALVAQA
jgi:hypothetical protein